MISHVLSSQQISPTVRLIELSIESDNISFEPGAHIVIDVEISGRREKRFYSMVRRTEQGFNIAVRLVESTRGGSPYMWALRPGDTVEISMGRNGFPLSYDGSRYVLIAGGIGITPMLEMARVLARKNKALEFHYCVRTKDDAPFLDELRELLGDRLHFYAADGGEFLPAKELIKDLNGSDLVYMCGPLGLMDVVKVEWNRAKLPSKNLRLETFGNSGHNKSAEFEVLVRETGARILVPEDSSLLEALRAADQPVMYECLKGECGLCKVEIEELNGEIDHRDVFFSDLEKASKECMCACVSRLTSGNAVIGLNHVQHGKQEGSVKVRRKYISPVFPE